MLLESLNKYQRKTHGMGNTTFYKRWHQMKRNCISNAPIGEYYKANSIKFCVEWLDFIKFKEDMYSSYLQHVREFGIDNTVLIRLHKFGNFEIMNCYWGTKKMRRLNQTRNLKSLNPFKAISPTGEVFKHNNVSEFARNHNLDRSGISNCIHKKSKSCKGWMFERTEVIL